MTPLRDHAQHTPGPHQGPSTEGGPETTNDPRRYDELHEGGRPPASQLPDRTHLQEYARQFAAADAGANLYSDPFLASHGKPLLAENRLWQQVQKLRTSMDNWRRENLAIGHHLVRVARVDLSTVEDALDTKEGDLGLHQESRDHHLQVLQGKIPGEHDGDWTDVEATAITSLRSPQDVTAGERRRRWVRGATYLGLLIADVVAVYLVMFSISDFGFRNETTNNLLSLAPTLILCTFTVGMGHFIGVQIKRTARIPNGRLTAWLLVGLLMTTLGGTQYFLAILRQTTVQKVDPEVVRWMWFFVMVGISAIAALLAAHGYNPHRRLLLEAHRSVLTTQSEIQDFTSRRIELRGALSERERSVLAVDEHWEARMADLDDEWANLAAIYRHELARQLGDSSITTALEVAPFVRPDNDQRQHEAAEISA